MGRGITNNAVEFLVQLAIDEDSSRSSINKFIKSISDKTIKFTYAVNVGESNKNIKTFLDKNNGKVLKVVYDVDKTTSNRNFKTFLESHKQSTGVMVYDVDVKKTQANVNASLLKIKAQKLITDLDINKTVSRTNINKYITDFKPKKILAQVGIDSTLSKQNINTFFDAQKTRHIEVALKLAKGAFNEVREKSKEVTITGIKTVLQLDVAKTKETIKTQIEKMKLPKFKVDVIARVTPNVVKGDKPLSGSGTQGETKSPSNQETLNRNKAKEGAGIELSGYVGTIKEVKKQIKKEFADAGKEVTIFEGNVLKAQDAFIKKLEASGAKLNIVRDAQTKEIMKISATVRNSENEVMTTVYKPLVATYDNLNAKVKEGAKEVRGLVAQTDRIDSKEVFDLDKATASLTKKFEQAKHKGYLLDQEIENINKAMAKLSNNNDVAKLESDLDKLTRQGKQQVELERQRNNVIRQREQLLANITRTEKLYSRTHDKDEANAIKSMINSKTSDQIQGNALTGQAGFNTRELREYSKELSVLQMQYANFHARATEETKNQMGILSAIKVAMEKFPIWMLASTAFYGTIATFRTFGEVIIDVDKKMTDLKKVMSEDTDFGAVFDSATRSAETFGKTISESLDAYVMFAKQGFKGDELESLSNAAIVAGNVGDIEAGKASEYMVASMLQWDKDTSQAMGVVDSWNEISNNFATTVENLAQGQAKAGATARALGMDFDQLNAVVGTLNARTKQSGNEIGNFVKSTFSNILSAKGRKVLDSLGVELENEDGSMRDLMQVYKEVAKEYVKLNQADKNSVTLGLAGKYHISRMQTLLDDLGSANSMYEDMYETSKNSENSAMVENQKYLQSLEARINLARVEIEKLSLAIGEAFLTDGMITALQLFSKMLGLITDLVDVVGALPVAFLATVTALTLFSRRFNDLVKRAPELTAMAQRLKDVFSKDNQTSQDSTSPTPAPRRTLVLPTRDVDSDTSSVDRNTTAIINNEQKRVKLNRTASASSVAYRGNLESQTLVTRAIEQDTDSTNRNTEAKKRGAKAMTMFSAGFGALGIGAIAVGFALEALLGKIGEVRREQEELRNTQEQVITSFKSNQASIEELSKRYAELSNQDLAPDSEGYAELLEVQNELADLLPDLKIGEDKYGNAILQNSTIVQGRVDILKEQIRLEKQLNDVKASKEAEEAKKQAKEDYLDQKDNVSGGLESAQRAMTGNRTLMGFSTMAGLDPIIDNVEDLLTTIQKLDTFISSPDFAKMDNISQSGIKALRSELISSFEDVNTANIAMQSSLSTLKIASEKNIGEVLSNTTKLSEEFESEFIKMAGSALSFADTSKSIEDLEGAFESISVNEELKKSIQEYIDLTKLMKESGISDVTVLQETYGDKFEKISQAIIKATNLNPDKQKGAFNDLTKALNNAISGQFTLNSELKKIQDEFGYSAEEAQSYLDALGETGEASGDSSKQLSEYVDSIIKHNNQSEEMIWYTEGLLDETQGLITVYESLIGVTDRTAQEQGQLDQAMNKLIALYPHAVSHSNFRVEALENEIKTGETLLEAEKNLADGKLTEEEKRTYYATLGTNARIRLAQQEIMAMETANGLSIKKFYEIEERLKKYGTWSESNPNGVTESEQLGLMQMSYMIVDYQEALSELDGLMVDHDSNLESVATTNKKYSSSTKESKAETDEVKKVTDKYNLTLEKNKNALDEINRRKNKYATHTEKYRNALREENILLQKQIELNSQQAKELGSIVSTTDTSTGTGRIASENKKLSGWNNPITSGYGAKESFRTSAHTGVDVDGKMGERLDANVDGKVTYIGKDDISGNFLKVLDSNGFEHFYGHLQSITVELNNMVKVGQELGKIGATGNVVSSTGDGSHLHYQVKKNGKLVDPTQFAKSARGEQKVYSSSPSTTTKTTGGSNQEIVWNYFKSKGLSDNAVAGIMGNIQAESVYDPNAGKNAKNHAYGLVQWRGGRREGLNTYAQNKGTSASDIQTQLEYIWKELNSTESSTLKSLQKNLSATDHAKQFEALFERSGGALVNRRMTEAEKALNAYAGTAGATTSGQSAISGGSGSDEAQVEALNLQKANAENQEKIAENNFKILVSYLDEYAYNRNRWEEKINEKEAEKAGYLTTSDEWESATNSQYSSQKAVRQSVNDELWQVGEFLKRTDINDAQRTELLDRQAELQVALKEAFNGVKEYYSQVVQGRLDRFDGNRGKYQNELDWESVKIQSVDPTSERYVKTLERANLFRGKLADNIKEEQKYIEKQLDSGQLTIEMYQTLTDRARELKKEAIEIALATQQTNFEIVQNRVNNSNEKIDDIDFDIDRSVSIQNLYEEGSADQLRELNFQLEKHKEKLDEIDKIGKNIKSDMVGLDLGHADLSNLEEQLEENTLAWYAQKEAIQQTEEAIKAFSESIDEKVKDMREDLADEIIDALKDAYEEARDIKIEAIEEEIELENERHEKVMKQYEDELEMFNDIIDAKRREIEDSDRDRTHDNNIDELEEEMGRLVQRKNAISGITTYDATKERKELDEQIKEVQKQIDEEYYQYSKELQLQALDDELEERNEFIEGQQELEDKTHEENIERLDEEKIYWNKHYDDLVNDERRFHEIRETMTKGTNEEIQALMGKLKTEIEGHIGTLKASLPDLQDTFNGTMKAVGANIRDTVIFELEQLILKMQETQEEVTKLQNAKNNLSNDFGNSLNDRDDDLTHATDKENGLTENDMKVLMAKFVNEKMTKSLNSKDDKNRIKNIKDKTYEVAKEAREGENGSKIGADVAYDKIIEGLSQDQLKKLGEYYANHYAEFGFSTGEYNKYVQNYGKEYQVGDQMARGDMQVMFAKYLSEFIRPLTDDKTLKNGITDTANKIAKSGREENGSLIKSTIDYDTAMKAFNNQQKYELAQFMLQEAKVISDGALRSKLEEYAENLLISNTSNRPVGLDTGGMTKAWGSNGGVDGKGGKYAVLHEREVVLNPIDTQRMFKISSIMETIMSKISGAVKLPTLSKPSQSFGNSDNSTHVHINIDKMSGTQSDIDNLSKQITNRLLREKGKR